MHFTERQLVVIVGALRCAAEQYASDATTIRAHAPEHEPIAAQFDRQRAEAVELADRLEYGDAHDEADDESDDGRSTRHYPSLEGEAA